MARPDLPLLRAALATTALGTIFGLGLGLSVGLGLVPGRPALAQSPGEQPATAIVAPPTSDKDVATPVDAPQSQPAAAEAAPQPPVAETNPLLGEIRRQLAEQRGDGPDAAALAAFYSKRSGAPVWVDETGLTARARHAMAEIARADDWGLSAAQFDLPDLQSASRETRALAVTEIKLAAAVLKYARHARGGRVDPQQLSPNLDQKLALRDPAVVLEAMAASETPGDDLIALHPRHPQFQKLREALLKARAGDAQPAPAPETTFVILPELPQLKSGSKHAQVPMLRQRLGLEPRPGDTLFDAELVEALKAFQRGKGLQASGQLTPKTRQLLNAAAPRPAAKPEPLAPKLLVNMDRWRWMPENMGAFHVWQNTPEYTVRVIKDDAVIHQARVVVGKIGNQTPVFSARMQYIVFHPEWGVPDSIKVKEILPYLRPAQDDIFSFLGGAFGGGVDTRVLEKHNLRVSFNGRPVDASAVNWSQVDIRRYTFIQPAGGTNVLGLVKFRFPNKHDVYMHDTPQRELFAKEARAFSHGCVRVQDPIKFAEVLLAQDKGWLPETVQGILAGGETQEVELTNRIPVHLSYFTTVAGDDGQIRVFDDIYGHDARIAAALAGRPMAPDVVADATTPEAPGKGKKGRKRQPIIDNLW